MCVCVWSNAPLPTFVHNKIKLYADDVLLYSFIHTVDDCIALRQDLDLLSQWSHNWMISFNPQKCKVLRVTNKRNPILHNYYIEDALIKEVSSATYLGVTIDSKLTWNNHNHRIVNKANRINTFLHRNLCHCPSHVKYNCYKSMVRPIVEYASPFGDPHTSI